MPEIRRMGYLLIGLLGLTLLTAFVWRPAPPSKFVGFPEARLPEKIDSFSGTDVPVDAATKAALPSAEIVNRQYVSDDGLVIDVTIIGGTGRSELHDPRSCLTGAGWQIQNDHVEQLPAPADIGVRSCIATLPAISASDMEGATPSDDILYLYDVDHTTVASASAIRWTLLKSDLLEQSDEPVYFVRALAEAPRSGEASSSVEDEHQRLAQFMSDLWSTLAPLIGEGTSR